MRIKRAGAIALGALATVGAVTVPTASGAKTPVVKVADDFFAPVELKVKPGTQVNFKWSSENSNPHNVTPKRVPQGVKKKKFTSATGSIGVKFKPTFEKKGTYEFLCTIHPTVMTMKVTVKR